MTSAPISPGHLAWTGPGRRTVLATAVALAAGIGTTASPAFALGPRAAVVRDREQTNLAYSADGVEYSAIFPVLFTAATRLVPGEGVAESLWIRNDNAMAVNVSLAVPASGGIEQGDLRAGLLPQPVVTLEAGASSELQAHVWLPESAGNDAQAQRLPVRLQVIVGEADAGGTPDSGTGYLSDTGGSSNIWPVGLAVMMGGVGALIAARKRPAGSAADAAATASATGGSS
ncbi:hypothetical protein SAMN04489740_1983 [Arthrobacter alpinus]|uniref:Uncharacterized protein n=1 Tax=Arthrobacter alpinus TaxID=656366 RepID=A0A1H5KER9_9MICC|nr:hypothetical protein [Arthrobacter alpinus]SEE63326.1 hypothetical protein SAMN04489740_1983 [Arthrobacter alpinus]